MAISVIGGTTTAAVTLDDPGTPVATFQVPNSDNTYRLPYTFTAGVRYTLRMTNPFSNSTKAPMVGFYSGTSPLPQTTYGSVTAGLDTTIILDAAIAATGLYVTNAANMTFMLRVLTSNAVAANLVTGNMAAGSFSTGGWNTSNADYTTHRPAYLPGVGYVETASWIYNSNTPAAVGFSSNGTTWTDSATGVSASQFGCGAGNGIFMITMNGNRVFTSTNGTTWTSRSTPFQGNGPAVFGNGAWILTVNDGLRVMRSTDNGVTWNTYTSSATANGYSYDYATVAYGNNIWVLTNGGNGGGRIATSPDGITWTTRTPRNTTDTYYGITFANGIFMMSNFSFNGFGTSTDGINWSWISPNVSSNNCYQLAYGNGAWFYTDAGQNAYLSFDNGVSFTTVATGLNFSGLRHWFAGERFMTIVKRSSPQAYNTIYSSPFATIS